jgi:2,5-diketo-D-gluconate reductase B
VTGNQVLEAAGVRIPRLGLGTFKTSPDEAREIVRSAVEVGYRHIDTALAYKNESGVGQGVRDSSVPRSEIFVTTKFPHMVAAPGDVADAAWTSIRALDLDYVDLLLMHWPNAEVPVGETLQALAPLVTDGVVRALGLSNAPAALVREALRVTPLATVQVEHHPYLPQDALRELVTAEGMTLTAYAPFAEGRVFDDPVLASIGAKYGKNPGQVTLRWLLDQPRTVVIPKTVRPERLAQNLDVWDFELDAGDVRRINALGVARQRFFDPPWQSYAWDER